MSLQIEITELGHCNASVNHCSIPRVEIVALPSVGIFPLHGIESFVMTLADDDDADLRPIAEIVGVRGLDLR